MFDFAWSEIALIVVVAVVFIGPKDLPVAIKAVTAMLKKARRMAGEFQTHVDEMVREADLSEVRDGFNKIRSFDFKGTVERAVDPDRTMRDTFTANPFEPTLSGGVPFAAPREVSAQDPVAIERPEGVDSAASESPIAEPQAKAADIPPAFIPPGFKKFQPAVVKPAAPRPPAFIPPGAAG